MPTGISGLYKNTKGAQEANKNEGKARKMELKDTIEGMQSTDYKERFKAEYHQTKIRYEKLKAFCNKIEAAECAQLDGNATIEMPKHDCPLALLRDQQSAMGRYLHVLEIRAVIEGVDLDEI